MKKLFTLCLFLLFSFFTKAQINWQISNQFNQYWGIDGYNPQQICSGQLFDTLGNNLIFRVFAHRYGLCQHIYRRSDLINDSIYIDLQEDWTMGCAMAEDDVCFQLIICPLDSLTPGRTIRVNSGSYTNPATSSWMNVKRLGNLIIYNDFAVPINDFKLTTFSNPNFTKLNWSLTNNNSQNFIVERSLNGSHFEAIANLKANKNSSEEDIYSFTDETKNNSFFYRIKNIDIDEKFTYSNTEYVKNDFKKYGISVVENPLNNNQIKIHFEGQKDENFTIKLVDILGKIIYKNEIMITNDDYYFNQTIQSNSSKILIAQLENQSTGIITFFKLIAQ